MNDKNIKTLYSYLTYIIMAIPLFFVLSPKIASANWNGGSTGSTPCRSYCSSVRWGRTTFRRPDDLIKVPSMGSYTWYTIDGYFSQLGLSHKLNEFLNSPDQYILFNSNGYAILAIYDVGDVREYTGTKLVPGYTYSESAKILNETINKEPGFRTQPIILYGDFKSVRTPYLPDVPKPPGETPPAYLGNCYVNGSKASRVKREYNKNDKHLTGDYSYYIQITPVKPVGFENLTKEEQTEWYTTHKTQITPVKLSKFGQFIKDFNYGNLSGQTGSDKVWDSFYSLASSLDLNFNPEDEIELTETNKKGFQRGGVFTVTTMTKKVDVYASTTVETIYDYTCYGAYWSEEEKRTIPGTYLYTGYRKNNYVSDPEFKSGVGFSRNNPGLAFNGNYGYAPRKSYQILNVRCNKEEFNKVISSTGSIKTSYGNGSSSSAVSPTVDRKVASFFNGLTVSFFYNGQDCDFKCSANPVSSLSNDASLNVQNRPYTVEQKEFGAQNVEKISGDRFSFFRDNLLYLTRIDVWHPNGLNSDVVFDENTPAFKTTITLDKTGTPKGELFNLYDNNEKLLLSGANLQNNSSVTVEEQLNKIKWQGAFASEKDKGHKANIYYAYQTNLITNVPVLGFNEVKRNVPTSTENLDISCLSTFNTTDSIKAQIHGSPKSSGYKPNTSYDKTKNKQLIVNFVKSSAE